MLGKIITYSIVFAFLAPLAVKLLVFLFVLFSELLSPIFKLFTSRRKTVD